MYIIFGICDSSCTANILVAIHCMYCRSGFGEFEKCKNMLSHKMARAKRIYNVYMSIQHIIFSSPDALVIDNTRERKDMLSKFD